MSIGSRRKTSSHELGQQKDCLPDRVNRFTLPTKLVIWRVLIRQNIYYSAVLFIPACLRGQPRQRVQRGGETHPPLHGRPMTCSPLYSSSVLVLGLLPPFLFFLNCAIHRYFSLKFSFCIAAQKREKEARSGEPCIKLKRVE